MKLLIVDCLLGCFILPYSDFISPSFVSMINGFLVHSLTFTHNAFLNLPGFCGSCTLYSRCEAGSRLTRDHLMYKLVDKE